MCRLFFLVPLALFASDLERARDAQDRAGVEKQISALAAAAEKNPKDSGAQYRLALANSYLAEIAIEVRDKNLAKSAADSGIKAAERAVALNAKAAENHRVLGVLCGQIIYANVLSGLRYGRCALEAVNKAVELAPNDPENHLARGVGNYYLPTQFGGGVDKAITDLQRATQLNAKFADAWLWLGVALRKANRNAEAHQAFQKSLALNPARVWAKQQLEKTPAK
jgi:tetratricopeptide (TPR) repeat protein